MKLASNGMKKFLAILITMFIILLLAPIIFHDRVKIDLPEFISQYYIFILNAFLVLGFGLWINKKIQIIEESINTENQKGFALDLSQNILKNIQDKDFILLQKNWKNFRKISGKINPINPKIDMYVKSLNANNFDLKVNNPIYRETISFLKDYEKRLC